MTKNSIEESQAIRLLDIHSKMNIHEKAFFVSLLAPDVQVIVNMLYQGKEYIFYEDLAYNNPVRVKKSRINIILEKQLKKRVENLVDKL